MKPHEKQISDLLGEHNVSADSGLSSAQVDELSAKYGPNKLKEKKKKSSFVKFLEQFKDAMIIILLVAAVVSLVITCVEKEWGELFEPGLILLIVVLNAIMGVAQENKAERALDALKNMSAPHARVIRDGKETVIDASELVPGDIISICSRKPRQSLVSNTE